MAFQRKSDKWKLKKWFTVYAPKAFNSVSIGEMPANDEKVILNRDIYVSLDFITHNPANAYTNMVFKITSVDGNSAHTRLARIELIYSYVRSLVRRYHSVADCVLTVKTKDDTSMIVKLLLITKSRTAHSRIAGMRKEATEFTKNRFLESDTDTIVSDIIAGKFQSALASKVKHIAETSKVEVRRLDIK